MSRDTSPERNNSEKINICVRIHLDVQKKWYDFVERKHGAIRGPCGMEIEEALIAWMENDSVLKQSLKTQDKMNKRTINAIHAISNRFRKMDQFPLLSKKVMGSVSKKITGTQDPRTILKYVKIILKHSKKSAASNRSLLYDVSGFCKYADSIMS